MLFILALDQLIQLYDKTGKGIKCNDKLTVRVLGYADDAALVDERIEEMTTRLTTLADESVKQADMYIRMDKTFSHHVKVQEKQTVTHERRSDEDTKRIRGAVRFLRTQIQDNGGNEDSP